MSDAPAPTITARPADPDAITHYHAHIYYDPPTTLLQ